MKKFKLFFIFPQKYESFFFDENKNNISVIFVIHSQRRQTATFFDGQSCVFIAENSREFFFVSMRFARG